MLISEENSLKLFMCCLFISTVNKSFAFLLLTLVFAIGPFYQNKVKLKTKFPIFYCIPTANLKMLTNLSFIFILFKVIMNKAAT